MPMRRAAHRVERDLVVAHDDEVQRVRMGVSMRPSPPMMASMAMNRAGLMYCRSAIFSLSVIVVDQRWRSSWIPM